MLVNFLIFNAFALWPHDSGHWLDNMGRKETLSWWNFSFMFCMAYHYYHYFHFGFIWISYTILFVLVKVHMIWLNLFLILIVKAWRRGCWWRANNFRYQLSGWGNLQYFKLNYSWLFIHGMFIDFGSTKVIKKSEVSEINFSVRKWQ